MERECHEFFADTAFAFDEDRHLLGSRPRNARAKTDHRWAIAKQVVCRS